MFSLSTIVVVGESLSLGMILIDILRGGLDGTSAVGAIASTSIRRVKLGRQGYEKSFFVA